MSNDGTTGEKTVTKIHKDDVLTQDARLADCRGAKFTVKVAVGLKICSRNARMIQHEMHSFDCQLASRREGGEEGLCIWAT